MTFDDRDRVDSNSQADSPPIYPPANGTDEQEGDRTERDRQAADREVSRPIADVPADTAPVAQAALFERRELDDFNARWSEIQTGFVDQPRRAVQQADRLVSDVIAEIGDSFGKQRTQLEGQWVRGDEVSTEDLRQIFQRYRSFFSRLLGI